MEPEANPKEKQSEKDKEYQKHVTLLKGVVGSQLPGSMDFLMELLGEEPENAPKKKKTFAERLGLN